MESPLPFSEACERNKDPILAVLRTVFAASRTVLEIGSGTGQHAVHFAAALPHLVWQPTEQDVHLAALAARVTQSGLPNLRAPLALDVMQPLWPGPRAGGIFTANTLHILSWPGVEALFQGIGRSIAPGGTVGIYGPFNDDGRYTSPSNERFDEWLRARDAASGIRDLGAVRHLAAEHGLRLRDDHALPANNRLVVFESAV